MSDLASNARVFESSCLGTRAFTGSCDQFLDEISSGIAAIGRGIESAEEDARHSWVSPGFVRELRQKQGLDESASRDLEATVRRLSARYHDRS